MGYDQVGWSYERYRESDEHANYGQKSRALEKDCSSEEHMDYEKDHHKIYFGHEKCREDEVNRGVDSVGFSLEQPGISNYKNS